MRYPIFSETPILWHNKGLAKRMIRKKEEDGKNWPTRILSQ